MSARFTLPDWVDPELYPFEPRTFETAHGRLRYVDEGAGPPVLLAHGTPTWSFLFRDVIRELARDRRVVAPDHLGFGLSDKPADAPYRPRDHAARLVSLIDALGLDGATLVVHDFGGPIGLSAALERPAAVGGLVLMNTWAWSLAGTTAERASRLFATPVGRFLYTRLNLSPRVLLPAGFADRSRLTRRIHRHYLAPFADAGRRRAPWHLARALADSGAWYEALWRRSRELQAAPTRLIWGMKDPTFGPAFLARWREGLPGARVTELPETGHFVPEEADARELANAIRGTGAPSRAVGRHRG